MNSSKKNPPNLSCFTSLLEKIVCTGNLPTHPCSLEEIKFLETNPNSRKKKVSNNNNCKAVVVNNSRVQTHQVTEANPGIIARLMGLDSLPTYQINSKSSSTTYDSLFRSKSLNSVQFLPNFDPIRATFHRRARTSSASFHEQGCSLLVKIDENLETNDEKMKVVIKENVVILKENNECTTISNKKRYQQERYYRGKCTTSKRKFSNRRKNSRVNENVGNNNSPREKCAILSNNNSPTEKCAISGRKFVKKDNKNMKNNGSINNNSSKNKIDQSDTLSRSPVSVLDNPLEFDSPSRQENVNARTSRTKPRRKSSPKISLHNDTPKSENNSKVNKYEDGSSNKITSEHKSSNTQFKDVTEYFEGMSKQIYLLAEDQLCEDLTRHIRKYDLFKRHFIEEFCQDFGEDIIDFLLNKLANELVESFS